MPSSTYDDLAGARVAGGPPHHQERTLLGTGTAELRVYEMPLWDGQYSAERSRLAILGPAPALTSTCRLGGRWCADLRDLQG